MLSSTSKRGPEQLHMSVAGFFVLHVFALWRFLFISFHFFSCIASAPPPILDTAWLFCLASCHVAATSVFTAPVEVHPRRLLSTQPSWSGDLILRGDGLTIMQKRCSEFLFCLFGGFCFSLSFFALPVWLYGALDVLLWLLSLQFPGQRNPDCNPASITICCESKAFLSQILRSPAPPFSAPNFFEKGGSKLAKNDIFGFFLGSLQNFG